jgi:hypothetical protein
MKKKVIAFATGATILIIGLFAALLVDYKTNNLKKPFVCSSINDDGKIINKNIGRKVAKFSSSTDKIYFVCERNKFFIKKAKITWYSNEDNKSPIKTENVKSNKDGYFISQISKAEGLKKGSYHAYIDIKSGLELSKEVVNFNIQ